MPPLRTALALLLALQLIASFMLTGARLLAPEVSTELSTYNSLIVTFPMFVSDATGDIIAYELSYRALDSPNWIVASSSIEARTTQYIGQIVAVRVDAGQSINGGFFTLGLERYNLVAEDFHDLARTAQIPWNADTATFKAALGLLANAQIFEVRRCDESGTATEQMGAFEGWSFGCPYLLQGGYNWLVVFKTPISAENLPLLFPFENNMIPANTWTGPGPQIMVSAIPRGLMHPHDCRRELCNITVNSLDQGMLYAFRYRGLSASGGWTDYSKQSEFVSTVSAVPPSRPRPPLFSSASSTEIAVVISPLPRTQQVLSYELQYRLSGTTNNWSNGPVFSTQGKQLGSVIVLQVTGLAPLTSYETRLRALNAFGYSYFSASSVIMNTTVGVLNAVLPSPVVEGQITSSSVTMRVFSSDAPGLPSGQRVFALQFRLRRNQQWTNYQSLIKFSAPIRGVQVQEIVVMEDSLSDPCKGTFSLSVGATDMTRLSESVTVGIPFGALPDIVAKAISNIGFISDLGARVIAYRDINAKGYTYRVEIQGVGNAIPTLSVYKILYSSNGATYSNSGNSSSNGTMTESYLRPSIQIQTIKNAVDTFQNESMDISVYGLKPKSNYVFRLQASDPYGRSSLPFYSPEVNVTTISVEEDEQLLLAAQDNISRFNLELDDQHFNEQPGIAVVTAGNGTVPARTYDNHYISGVGVGGFSGQNGGPGHCVVTEYNPRTPLNYQAKRFFFVGTSYLYRIAAPSPTTGDVQLVTFKCWGGGGGGGKIFPDLTRNNNSHLLSPGGGGAFAQTTIALSYMDTVVISVGGGGAKGFGEDGGLGGAGNGGNGGRGMKGGGGGGGGGASVISKSGVVILVAAGGGGGGATDYCCASGGAGGGEQGISGSYPGASTPWPLALGDMTSPVPRRFEYTASSCPNDLKKNSWCISEWDILPGSLPAEHKNLQYGQTPQENYTAWSTAGSGGTGSVGGSAGASGSYVLHTTGDPAHTNARGIVAVYSLARGIELQARAGTYLSGGDGADGKEGGGGGGSGYFGGGGGGSGIDGAGGGGGASYVNTDLYWALGNTPIQVAATIPAPVLTFVNCSHATVSMTWTSTVWAYPSALDMEISYGPYSDDFFLVETTSVVVPSSSVYGHAMYTFAGLSPSSTYRFRAVPQFVKDRGSPSQAITVMTLALAVNYWEPITTRRSALASVGLGYSYPVVNGPYLSPGSEVFGKTGKVKPFEYSDPPTENTPVLPSPRRGHSMSLIDQMVYMFGGRTDGYSCASIYTDTLDLGILDSGRSIYPCTKYQSEVHELWSLDIMTYRWNFINTTISNKTLVPPPREQHSAVVVNGDLYIFGGKSRFYPTVADTVYNDLWRLNVQHSQSYSFNWSGPLALSEIHREFISIDTSVSGAGDGVDSRIGRCIKNVIVSVEIVHPCANQLKISLMGPGPQTGSPNFHAPSSSFEVLLFDERKSSGLGCMGGTHRFTFDDSSTRATYLCCSETYSGTYRPEGRLLQFAGAAATAQWTLVVEDMKTDGTRNASVVSWSLKVDADPCVRNYSWVPLDSAASPPDKRYHALSFGYGQYIFIYGGRDSRDSPLSDLMRYDTKANIWTVLTPVNFNIALASYSSVGYNLMFSSWGLLRYGGYSRFASNTGGGLNYMDDVFLLDPITLHWSKVEFSSTVNSISRSNVLLNGDSPPPRYLSAAVFIPASSLTARNTWTYRSSYDELIPSTQANFAGQITDSVFIFGGHNGATGSIVDGSSGGMLNDAWALRFGNWSIDGNRVAQAAYQFRFCQWRRNAKGKARPNACISSISGSSCELRDLLLLSWCETTDTLGMM